MVYNVYLNEYLWLIKGKVNFGPLCFYIGKCMKFHFRGNFISGLIGAMTQQNLSLGFLTRAVHKS